jgi:hypothetical protein
LLGNDLESMKGTSNYQGELEVTSEKKTTSGIQTFNEGN